MTYDEPIRASLRRLPGSAPARPAGITVYECGADEAELFRAIEPRYGVPLILTDAALSEETTALAFGNRCISVGHRTPVPRPVLLGLSRLGVRYLSTRSVGVDHIDVEYARNVGITVGTVSYSPDSVADYTVMLILMALRDAKSLIRRTDRHDYRLGARRGRELRDLTVGVVGTGRIGRAVIDRLGGFGCRVLTCDRSPGPGDVTLDDLLRRSDVVTLHTPLTPETHHLLDRRRLGRMRPGAVVVNTGRGGLIDTAALVSALESGEIGCAALDVIEGEEGVFYTDRGGTLTDPALTRLQDLPTAIISPHTAYYTDHALADTVENSLTNCLDFERRETA
ncbi:NAD(P)-dependent oxidoreductase [Tsukamurella sp. 1534]|uniref:NAD(P)-dependent oxidoreductase n=1 Tax=Tsukamurella sp. 1534 TaxID=1151061 RepID=UPI0002F10994|nr:NAD(P)-dependent oxidoreductase [Tsukamurella sp. 1534]